MAALPLDTLLRRARRDRGLTQAELAKRANVTQGAISNYERGVMLPGDGTLQALARALHADVEDLRYAPRDADSAATSNVSPIATHRAALMQTVTDLPTAGVWERSVTEINGDLAFSLTVGDWMYLVLIDGAGAGADAAMSSIVAAAFAQGIISRAKGVAWPSEVMEQIGRVPMALGGPGQAAVLVVLFDKSNRSLYHARTQGMPAPFLRDRRAATSPLTGSESRLGRFREGRIHGLSSRSLLLTATDGVANAARAKGRPLWTSPDVRTWLTRASDPRELANRVGERASTGRPAGSEDDMLVVAVGL